jgi:protein-tyrosine phosphatase
MQYEDIWQIQDEIASAVNSHFGITTQDMIEQSSNLDMDKTKILFICLGNICRSPAANAIMQKYIDDAELTDKFYIDSAGIGPWHVGQLPDKRMRQHGARRGYRIDHIARQFDARHDFDDFDYIVVMDDENYHDICRKAHNEADRRKVIRMADYFTKYKGRTSVPDPYYGDGEDFELALDLIEDGCEGMLDGLIYKTT